MQQQQQQSPPPPQKKKKKENEKFTICRPLHRKSFILHTKKQKQQHKQTTPLQLNDHALNHK